MAKICISDGLITSTDEFSFCAGSNRFRMRNSVHSNSPTEIPHLSASSLVVAGDLTVHGSCTLLNTTVCTTSAMSICNQGTGPALTVTQCGAQPIALFVDQECGNALCIGDIGTATFGQQVNIHNSAASYGTRLSVGRDSSQSIYFQVNDADNYIRANQDESALDHGFYLDRQFTTSTCRDDFHISRCGSPQVTVDICGRVGIGTTGPLTDLDVRNNLGIYAANAQTSGQIYLGSSDFAGPGYYLSAPGIGGIVSTGASQPNGLGFYTYTGAQNSRTERMRIEADGNVGIGTSNPDSYKLKVYGTCSYLGNYADVSCGMGAFRFHDGTTFRGGLGTDCWAHGASVSDIALYIQGDNDFFISTNGTKRFCLHSSGACFYNISGLASTPVLGLSNTASSTFIHTVEAFSPNMTSGQTNLSVIGKSATTKNSGYIGYYWTSDASNSNFVSIGHWGSDHRFRVYGDGTTCATLGMNIGGATCSGGSLTIASASTASGNIKFSGAANPYICASSYIVMPGGLYVSGGTAYFQNHSKHRNGLGNDSGAWLCITGGTAGDTSFGGNVGIGTTDPWSSLDICAASTAWGEGITIRPSSTGYGGLYIRCCGSAGSNSNVLAIGRDQNSGNNYFHILRNGKSGSSLYRGDAHMSIDLTNGIAAFDDCVGIGTSSPSAKLDVCGTGTVFSVNGTNGTLFSVEDDLSDSLMSVNDAAGLPVLEVFADNSVCAGRYGCSDFYIASGGQIGFGTSAPTFAAVSGNTAKGLEIANIGNDTQASLRLRGHNNTGTPGVATYTELKHAGGSLAFHVDHNGTNVITIDSNCNVAIGTTSAGCCKLLVVGDFKACDGWIRSNGDRGWYNDTYGGGIYMTDTSYMKFYNSKGLHMQNSSVHFVNELHFNDGIRLCGDGSTSRLYLCSGDAAYVRLDLGTQTTRRGSVYANNYNQVGFLDEGASWAIQHINDDSTRFYDTGETLRVCIGKGTTCSCNRIDILSNSSGTTGSSSPYYYDAQIEIATTSNYTPAISFHRGGYSATTLHEYDGELYVAPWTTRSQAGKLVSFGNLGCTTITFTNNGTNICMDGGGSAEGIRMQPDSCSTYPVFLRMVNPGTGEGSPWLYKEHDPAWGIWHNNPVNSFDFTRSGSGGIANNVGGGTNQVAIRLNTNTCQVCAAGSMVAPIYYDYNNTNCYVYPSSRSIINALNACCTNNYFGTGTWDYVGATGLTNLNMNGHNQFWFGAGNGTWFTGGANTKSQASGLAADAGVAHDLLITTMNSNSTYDRGITFAVDCNGNKNSGWRLGKWHAGDARDASKLVVDGQFFAKGGYTDEYDYYQDDYSAYYSCQGGQTHWAGDTGYGWNVPSIVASTAIQIQSANAGAATTRKPQIQFHQYGYGGPAIEYDGPNAALCIIGPSSRLSNTGFKYQGNTIWHAGNDGSGSGLDADLLDGAHASSTGGGNCIAKYSSNGYLNVCNWIYLGTSSCGIYSSCNGAYIYPNDQGDYGSWRIQGNRNGWTGIYGCGGTLMLGSTSCNAMGLFNDVNNHWIMYGAFNGCADLRYAGTTRIATTASGAYVSGNYFQVKDGSYSGVDMSTDIITVNGCDTCYYPVTWWSGVPSQARTSCIQIYRNYNDTAPSTWNTATHKGGLVFDFETNWGGWGGVQYDFKVNRFDESYSSMVGGASHFGNCRGFVVWLRGGGATYCICTNGAYTPTVQYNAYDPGGNSSGVSPIASVCTSLVNYICERTFQRQGQLYAKCFRDTDNVNCFIDPALYSRICDLCFNGQLFSHGNAGGTVIDTATNDGYVTMRVIRNASSVYNDGMFIGYGNSNSGSTRLYGGGSTSNFTYVSSNGCLYHCLNHVYWNAGNDGGGSGLDADLLDGQHGSYYLNYNNLSNRPTIPTNNNQLTNGAGYITSYTDTNYYLNGITQSGNTLTFSVNGTTNQSFTFGANAFNSTTIPTNTNQLTNGAGYTTCTGDITNVSAGTGLTGGGASGSVTLSLANTTVTAGTYSNSNITVDAQGRITSASNGSSGSTAYNCQITFVYGACIQGYISPDYIELNQTFNESICFAHSTGGAGSGNYSGGINCISLDSYGHVTSVTTGCSDYRVKTNVQPYTIGYEAVKSVDTYQYVLIDDEDKKCHAGMMAHELQEAGIFHGPYGIKDEVNEKGEPVYQTVNYSELVPTLWSALKTSICKIELLEETNNTLIDRIIKLEQAIGV